MDISHLLFTTSHEWVEIEGEVATVGITQFAVDQLTDVTHLELPKVGTTVNQLQRFGEIESVKAVFDLNCPVAGTVMAKNEAVENDPALINEDPYRKGWMIRVKLSGDVDKSKLLDLKTYEEQLASH
ncbi:MAG: glycine cleavage system protein GcvH [Zavarzinella sp.]